MVVAVVSGRDESESSLHAASRATEATKKAAGTWVEYASLRSHFGQALEGAGLVADLARPSRIKLV